MNKHSRLAKDMVATKNKNKVLSCSTPEHQAESPSRDSDSICDSEAASPVPFLCTQDGAEGLTDVVWNFYTPKSDHTAKSRQNSTPVSRRSKRSLRPIIIEKQIPKRKPVRATQKNTELFQELIELNENLHELIAKKTQSKCKEEVRSGSEDDLFNESLECSPKSSIKNKQCLRRNVLSSNFAKPDTDTALDSDDSINECLIKASQVVEENILLNGSVKRPRFDTSTKSKFLKTDCNFKIDQDSMDAILNSIKLESPLINNTKKIDNQFNNDSFDSLVGNLNDSALDHLTQLPIKANKISNNNNKLNTSKDWTIKELVVQDSSPSAKSLFGRHNSMPESPVFNDNKPSTSGMVFGRYNTMPYDNNAEQSTAPNDSPIRCTPEEIKKKHQVAREKLMAKRLLPFTSSQKSTQSSSLPAPITQLTSLSKKTEDVNILGNISETGCKRFQPKVASTVTHNKQQSQKVAVETSNFNQKSNHSDIKSIIEKKRQEALMKLRRRQIQSKEF